MLTYLKGISLRIYYASSKRKTDVLLYFRNSLSRAF